MPLAAQVVATRVVGAIPAVVLTAQPTPRQKAALVAVTRAVEIPGVVTLAVAIPVGVTRVAAITGAAILAVMATAVTMAWLRALAAVNR